MQLLNNKYVGMRGGELNTVATDTMVLKEPCH